MERTKQHLLRKLYSREIHGSFAKGCNMGYDKASKLFSKVPDRLMFYLKDTLQHMGNHILLGTTRCGQFLITYSYATDLRTTAVQLWYKYRLHWWAFRPGAPACKVAEVQLFDNQDIRNPLTITIAQWSRVTDKLVVYGFCDEKDDMFEHEEGDLEGRRYYITVTTLPSLHNCQDCKVVAESFDEEDMAANWDSCIRLSCLKHGLTMHTTLDIAPPYPSLDFQTNLKIDNKIIVNTGNFLHVLSFDSDKEELKPSFDDNITSSEICHNIGEKLSSSIKDYICPWKKPGSSYKLSNRRTLTRSVNKAWLNTIMDEAERVYAFEESEDGCEPRFKWFRRRRLADKMYEFCSDDEDMENIRPPPKIPRYLGPAKFITSKEKCFDYKILKNDRLKEESNKDSEADFLNFPSLLRNNKESEIRDSKIMAENPKYFRESIKNLQKEIEIKRRREQMEVLSKENVSSNSCDCDISNESDIQLHKRLDEESHRKLAVSKINIVDSVSCKSDCDNLKKLSVKESNNTPVSSTSLADPLPSKSDYHKITPLDVSIINPDLSAILAEWEADSVSSLSPTSDNFLYKNDNSENGVIQSFLELIPGITISPRSSNSGTRNSDYSWVEGNENVSGRRSESPHLTSRISSPNSPLVCKYSPLLVVLRTRNCNQDKEPQKGKEQEERCKTFIKDEVGARAKPGKDADINMRQRMILGCSVRFDRIYIEVDEEIISTITDIEDDDQGTGFHCALPLSVHGSAYAQLQMVSSHKAEKMNIHCEHVYQSSLDIDQFCFKAAEIICKCEGFKFWFCNDYDVEIISVCAFNGDILGVVCMRVNAEKKPSKSERHKIAYQRYFYEVRCVFIWNPGTDRCWLEAYSHLSDVTKHVHSHWAPAKQEAAKLRTLLNNSTLFCLQPSPPVRVIAHRMWNTESLLVPSLEEIRDLTNLIGFRLIHVPRRLRRYVEFL